MHLQGQIMNFLQRNLSNPKTNHITILTKNYLCSPSPFPRETVPQNVPFSQHHQGTPCQFPSHPVDIPRRGKHLPQSCPQKTREPEMSFPALFLVASTYTFQEHNGNAPLFHSSPPQSVLTNLLYKTAPCTFLLYRTDHVIAALLSPRNENSAALERESPSTATEKAAHLAHRDKSSSCSPTLAG